MSITLRQRMHQDLQLAGLAEGTQKMYPYHTAPACRPRAS